MNVEHNLDAIYNQCQMKELVTPALPESFYLSAAQTIKTPNNNQRLNAFEYVTFH